MDAAKDLIKLYHPSGQNPKEVATASEIVVGALYQLGLPAGSYPKVFKFFKYKLPSSVIVLGSDYRRYQYKGTGTYIDPVNDTYDTSGVGTHWVDLDKVMGCG